MAAKKNTRSGVEYGGDAAKYSPGTFQLQMGLYR